MAVDKTWKDALLKTGLPFEHIVAQKLSNFNFDLYGEYAYIRKNENDKNAEFSIDILAGEYLGLEEEEHWADLKLLVECKYNHPEVKWIFAPLSGRTLIITGSISLIDSLSTWQIGNSKPLYEMDDRLPYCSKGIELHAKDSNSQSITRGIHQLKYAALNLAYDEINRNLYSGDSEELRNLFICKILVTTAPLFVINEEITIEDFLKASDIEDVSEKVNALTVYQPASPQLHDEIRNVINKIEENHRFIKDLEKKIKKYSAMKSLEVLGDWRDELESLTERVIVVSFDALEPTLEEIYESIQKVKKSVVKLPAFRKEIFNRLPVIRIV